MSELDGAYNSFGSVGKRPPRPFPFARPLFWLPCALCWAARTHIQLGVRSGSDEMLYSMHRHWYDTVAVPLRLQCQPLPHSSYIQHLISSMEACLCALYLTHPVWWMPFKRDTLSQASVQRCSDGSVYAAHDHDDDDDYGKSNKQKMSAFLRALSHSTVTRKYKMLVAKFYTHHDHTRAWIQLN